MTLKKLEPIELPLSGFDIDEIDASVRSRWNLKDKDLKIEGMKKDFVGEKDGFRIYEVDSDWLRNNIDVGFGTGGHGLVHVYIPLDEIWVDPSTETKTSLILHEMLEFRIMKEKAWEYKEAHKKVNELTADLSIKEKKFFNIDKALREIDADTD